MDESKSIANTMHMYIHANGGQVEAHCDREISSLASNAWQFTKFLDGVRENAVKLRLKGRGERL